MSTRIRLLSLLTLLAALLAVAAPALAHVTVHSETAAAGAYTKLTFRVPHGCDGAPTTTVRVQMPDGVRGVRPQVHPGWELSTVEGELAEPYESHGETVTRGVTEVVWSGGDLPDAYMDEFGVSLQIAPDAQGETLHFPVIQECANGAEAAWIEVPEGPDAEEPEHPAPALEVTGPAPGEGEHAGGEGEHAGGAEASGSPVADDTLGDAQPAAATSGGGSDALSIAALVVGVAGLGVGGGALLSSRRR
jgi:uncharacterized protein YcnI